MSTLIYLSYNNYYNRILKRKNTINEYLENSTLCGEIKNCNFFPADGVRTEHRPYLNALELIPDYLIVTANSGEIESRWFVVECEYITGASQYKCTLLRDLIADFWNVINDKPFFCEKGWLPISDNGIFNDEAITTSQIKRGEYALKDGSYMPWIVGYYALPESGESDDQIEYSDTTITPDIIIDDLNGWLANNTGKRFFADWNVSLYAPYTGVLGLSSPEMTHFPFRPDVAGVPENGTRILDNSYVWTKTKNQVCKALANTANNSIRKSRLLNAMSNYANASMNISDEEALKKLNGKIILDSTSGNLFEIFLERNQSNENYKNVEFDNNLFEVVNDIIISALNSTAQTGYFGSVEYGNIETSYTINEYQIRLIATTLTKGSATIKTSRRPLFDAPYCMFAIPYGSLPVAVTDENGGDYFVTNALDSLNFATAIAAQTGAKCYDLQLLPYCPIAKFRTRDPSAVPRLSTLNEGQDYVIATDAGGNKKTLLLWAERASDEIIISSPISDRTTTYFKSNLNIPQGFKTVCQTEFWRICSPNYNGVFEMNPLKNRGVDYFTISYTYKPYQPFIQVSPNFKGLYGGDFNDARGLILGGDFSLAVITDEWKSYEIQNKNYQGMFNRQIENMETQHRYQRVQEIGNIVTGTIQGASTGAMAGMFMGGGYGAAAGAVVGGGASLAGGIIDYNINQALRSEALDYSKDLFGYQLDNIKALPYALTRVSAFNIKNKIFPFVEIYGTTPEEEKAVRAKIDYNGMTIGRIGTILEFTSPDELFYIKGSLIRLDTLAEDSHVVFAIANELNKGVYVNVNTI